MGNGVLPGMDPGSLGTPPAWKQIPAVGVQRKTGAEKRKSLKWPIRIKKEGLGGAGGICIFVPLYTKMDKVQVTLIMKQK